MGHRHGGAGSLPAAVVLYSQNDNVDDASNNIATPNSGNVCGVTGSTCDWTVNTRTGTVTLIAAIIDRDTKGTASADDDTVSIIGWATAPSLQVDAGVNQTGLALTMVEAGNLQTVTVDLGTPPVALTTTQAIVGVELASNEVVQLPLFIQTDQTSMLAPLPSVFAVDATYRLTAIAQTSTAAMGPESIDIERGLMTASLSVDRWLEPPTSVVASRTSAPCSTRSRRQGALDPVERRDGHHPRDHAVRYHRDVRRRPLLSLPATGTLTANLQGIGADLDVKNFSLENDKDLLWGESTQPITVP